MYHCSITKNNNIKPFFVSETATALDAYAVAVISIGPSPIINGISTTISPSDGNMET